MATLSFFGGKEEGQTATASTPPPPAKISPDDFVYWLQGYFEVSKAEKLDSKEAEVIIDKLQNVFIKKTSTDGSGYVNPNMAVGQTTTVHGTSMANANGEVYIC